MVATPQRGEVYWTEFDPARGSEIGKTRPALVIQNDAGNRSASTTIVAAVSSRYADREYPFLVVIPEGALPKKSVVNCAQVRTVDKVRLRPGRLAVLDPDTMRRVDEALRLSFALG